MELVVLNVLLFDLVCEDDEIVVCSFFMKTLFNFYKVTMLLTKLKKVIIITPYSGISGVILYVLFKSYYMFVSVM